MKTLPPRIKPLSPPVPINRKKPEAGVYRYVLEYSAEGKRQRKYFKSWNAADAACREKKRLSRIAGEGALGIRPGDAEDLAKMREILADFEIEPLQAVKEWADQKKRELASESVEEAYRVFIEHKERQGLRPRALSSLRNDLRRFVSHFSGKMVSTLEPKDVSDWIGSRTGLAPLTRLSILRRVATFLNWCGKRGWCKKGILADVDKPRISAPETEIFSPEEARALLEAASNVASEMVPYLALGLFCGLRTAELGRLDWEHVNCKEVHIEAGVAKTASRRSVPIPENAALWIAPYRKKSGPVRPLNARRMLDRVVKAAGVKWKPNACRHSFGSYRFTQTRNAALVTAELGHSSQAVFERHYRGRVKDEADGQRYFDIRPAGEASNVVPFASAGQRE